MSDHSPNGVRLLAVGQARLITKVAHLYHEKGMRQAAIADALHISQARVSRLLKRAADVGIVRTTVVAAQGIHTGLEDDLEQRYKLREAVIADVEGDETEILGGIGSVGAAYLEATLTGSERIGISSWSQTLLSVVDRLSPLRVSGAERVVQLVGGIGVPAVQAQANRLLTDLASLIGAEPTFFQAPGLVGTASIRRGLLADPAFDTISREWSRLTMALVGIGSLDPSPLLQQSGNAIDPWDQDQLLAVKAVGDVCQHYFDATGQLIRTDLDSRVVGIDPNTFRRIPRRVALAGGLRKQDAIHAALVGGWANVLVTDVGTARRLLR